MLAIYFIILSSMSGQSIGSYVISSAGDDLLSEEGGLYVSIGEALNTELDEGDIMVSQGFLQVSIHGVAVSTDELLKEDIVVYPNPASQYLIINTKDRSGNYSFRLSNVEGKNIADGQLDQEGKIVMEGLQNGMYFISIHKDGLTSEIIKVIKTK